MQASSNEVVTYIAAGKGVFMSKHDILDGDVGVGKEGVLLPKTQVKG